MDRVLALHAGSRGIDSHRGTCPNDFSDPIDQDIRTQWALSWKIVVSEWRSVIAVSLNVGGGVRLIKPAKLCMCTQTLQTQRGRTHGRSVCGNGSVPLSHSGNNVRRIGTQWGRTHGAGCVRQCFRTAEPLWERRYENWNTHTQQFTVLKRSHKCQWWWQNFFSDTPKSHRLFLFYIYHLFIYL